MDITDVFVTNDHIVILEYIEMAKFIVISVFFGVFVAVCVSRDSQQGAYNSQQSASCVNAQKDFVRLNLGVAHSVPTRPIHGKWIKIIRIMENIIFYTDNSLSYDICKL